MSSGNTLHLRSGHLYTILSGTEVCDGAVRAFCILFSTFWRVQNPCCDGCLLWASLDVRKPYVIWCQQSLIVLGCFYSPLPPVSLLFSRVCIVHSTRNIHGESTYTLCDTNHEPPSIWCYQQPISVLYQRWLDDRRNEGCSFNWWALKDVSYSWRKVAM